MPRSPHPSAAAEEKNSNSIPLMATFPALKVYHCQFCSQIFVTESARRNHNNMEFRDFALAHARMDSVGGTSGQAVGSRDVTEGEMDEAMDEAPTASAHIALASSSSSSSFRRHPSALALCAAEGMATPEENEASSSSSSSFRRRPSAVALCAAEGMATPE